MSSPTRKRKSPGETSPPTKKVRVALSPVTSNKRVALSPVAANKRVARSPVKSTELSRMNQKVSQVSSSEPGCGQIILVTDKDPGFDSVLEKIFSKDGFKQCGGKINAAYARRHMKARATVIAASVDHTGSLCGFALAFPKTISVDRNVKLTVFYVDLVCTQHKLGKQIMTVLETYAKDKTKIKVVALRAAVKQLIPVYEQKFGYKRQANACEFPSRAGRNLLYNIDKGAADLGGTSTGYYTDGYLVTRDIDEAWVLAIAKAERFAEVTGNVEPFYMLTDASEKKKKQTLPTGWYFDEGFHGWWMSKCLL